MAAEILLGTQGWSYPDWVGSFYPAGTRSGDFLRLYSQTFSTVELDSSFYGVPRQSMIDGWIRNTPASFRLAAKLPQAITHEKRLVDVREDLLAFLDVITRLGARLGPLLAQLPPDFRAGDAERNALAAFLELLPGELEFAVEFRHRTWHDQPIFDLLRSHGVAWCITDLHYLKPAVELTANFTYVRWLGDHRKIERFSEVTIDRNDEYDHWATTIRDLSSRVTRLYGYYNNHYAGHSPASVRQMQRRLSLPESPPPARGLFDL